MSAIFIDTNVLVYASSAASQFHRSAANALARCEDTGDVLCVSRQVLREYLATVTRPQAGVSPLDGAAATAEARRLVEIYAMLEDGETVTDRLLNLFVQYPVGGKQIHDANIVATMLAHGIPKLLTHNVADFNRFAARITVIPLVP